MTSSAKLAIITTHPIQYYAPWFRMIASDPEIELKVFYLWKPDDTGKHDPEFKKTIQWDIPLLDGYDYDWVENTSTEPGSHHFNGIQNPGAAHQIAKWRPDHVLCLGYNYRTFVQLCLSKILKSVPFLIRGDSHRLSGNHSFSQCIKDMMIRMLFSRFSGALSCGAANRQYFQQLGFHSDQIHFCPHGIDTSRFTPEKTVESQALRQAWGIPEAHKVILFAGKFIDKKRPLDLLTAFNQLDNPQSTLLFIGDGPLRDSMKAAASPNVIIHPFANQSKMPDIYRAADLLVLPSQGNFETWGLAVQEALACGTPAIASSHCGCHLDLIQPDRNGLVFEAGNITSLADSLAAALQPGTLERWNCNVNEVLKTYNYQTSLTGLKTAIRI